MIVTSIVAPMPGGRINDYRNSEPRHVKLLAIGMSAEQIVRTFAESNRDNLLFFDAYHPPRLQALDEPVKGVKPNAVIVVYQNGEAAKLPFLVERTASMLSFIVLESQGAAATRDDRKLRELRAIADLYVTTSDVEFVSELVANLAS